MNITSCRLKEIPRLLYKQLLTCETSLSTRWRCRSTCACLNDAIRHRLGVVDGYIQESQVKGVSIIEYGSVQTHRIHGHLLQARGLAPLQMIGVRAQIHCDAVVDAHTGGLLGNTQQHGDFS